MDGRERRAASVAIGETVGEVTSLVEEMSKATRSQVRRGLAPLGAPASATMDAVDGTHAFWFAATRLTSRLVSRATGEALSRTGDDARLTDNPSAAPLLAGISAAFGDRMDHPDTQALTTQMGLRIGAAAVSPKEVAGSGSQSPGICVFLHGLGGTELQWPQDYLETVSAAELTPVLIRYNTGRAISANAEDLSAMITELVEHWPVAVQRIVLVAHSMGGLVSRTALSLEAEWVGSVTHLITLGTPHEGAPLERFARSALQAAAACAQAAPLAARGDLRSQGVKDLGEGSFRQGAEAGDLPGHIRHVAVVAATGDAEGWRARLLGDGIVPMSSARAPKPDATEVVLSGHHHLDLLNSAEVCSILQTELG